MTRRPPTPGDWRAHQPGDKTVAFKLIAVATDFGPAGTRVLGVLLDHHHHANGRCDPGFERLARIGRCDVRTVRRAINIAATIGLLHIERHAGRHGTNRYCFNWQLFRDIDQAWKATAGPLCCVELVTAMSPGTGHPVPAGGDIGAPQTCNRNLSNKPVLRGAAAQAPSRASSQAARPMALETKTRARARPSNRPMRRTPASTDVAQDKAWQRCEEDLLAVCGGYTELYAQSASAITITMKDQATERELKRRGSGIRYLVDRLIAAGLTVPDGPPSPGHGGDDGQH